MKGNIMMRFILAKRHSIHSTSQLENDVMLEIKKSDNRPFVQK